MERRMAFRSILCEALNDAQQKAVRDELRAHRARVIKSQLSSTREHLADGGAGQHPGGDVFLAGLHALLKGAPERAHALIDHWVPDFYLQRLTRRFGRPHELDRFASNLLTMLLFERLDDGTSPLAGMRVDLLTDDAGAILAFRPGGRLRVRGLDAPRSRLLWHCDARRAVVRS